MRYLFGLLAGLILATGATADTIMFDYVLTGPTSTSPPTTFSTAIITPPAYSGATVPVLSASALTGSVTQSPVGLGVRSGTGLNTELILNPFRVDNVGIISNTREELRLTVSGIPNTYIDTRLTSATFLGVLDLGAAPDVEILKNGVSQGTFDYNGLLGGVLTLPTPISLMNGDVITFRPVNASQFNGFALAGVQIKAEVPEPVSVAVFGGLMVVGGLVARRRLAMKAMT
jgi:hypothetical protein